MTDDLRKNGIPRAEDNKMHGEVVREIGSFILKTLITLNSGAAIVLLTFTASIVAIEKPAVQVDLDQLRWSMRCFLLGIMGALLAATFTYFLAQAQYGNWRAKSRKSYMLVHLGMALPALIGFISFVAGFWIAAGSVTDTKPKSFGVEWLSSLIRLTVP